MLSSGSKGTSPLDPPGGGLEGGSSPLLSLESSPPPPPPPPFADLDVLSAVFIGFETDDWSLLALSETVVVMVAEGLPLKSGRRLLIPVVDPFVFVLRMTSDNVLYAEL